ncbi:hypothetical protein FWF89_01275 [Candidatus Saccharibacteria bacterium]|nr:hypothetical protein [Candidatus Saccharibacteria bacterium]
MSIKDSAKLLKNLKLRPAKTPRTEDDLINAESALGRTIFGPVPEGYPREFFHHQKNVWIWYENGTTIRYEVRQHGVFKKVSDGKYERITGSELENFRTAAKTYLKLVKSHLYR